MSLSAHTLFATLQRLIVAMPRARVYWALGMICLTVSMTGCQRWPANQAMRQYQVESDRLLSEFRAQKKRADDLESRNGQLEQRLAESEKLLARMQNGSNSRLSRSRNSSELIIGDARSSRGDSLSDTESSRSNRNRLSNRTSREGLPDATPGTASQLTSSGPRDPISLGEPRDLKGDPRRESQWRPIQR